MGISIERACIEDALKLVEVQNKSFYEDYITYGECPGYNHSEEKMKNIISNSIVYKIIFDNKIVGDIIVRKRENKEYYLGGICVIPEYQNLGIGQKAIKHIEGDSTDAVAWELETPFDKYRNHHFYEKMGYKKIDEYRHSDLLVLFKFRKEIRQ